GSFVIFNDHLLQNAMFIDGLSNEIRVGGRVFPVADNTYSLGLSGNRWSVVWAANGMIQTSDARLKRGINNLSYGVRDLMRLRPVSYQWKDGSDARVHLGLIAQEVDQVIPEVVEQGTDPNSTLGMNYPALVPVLIKAIQEQQASLDRKDGEISSLQ